MSEYEAKRIRDLELDCATAWKSASEKDAEIERLKYLLACFIELQENHSHLALPLPDRVEFKKEILRCSREAISER